jgi:hypothetical protein
MPTRPFFRVTEGSTAPIGQVRLLVTFGTHDNYRIESLDFNIAYLALPYNAILGYSGLAKFIAVTHHDFNTLKITSDRGFITVRCNERDTLHSIELVYHEAASISPLTRTLSSTQATSQGRRSSCRFTRACPKGS